MKVYPTQCGETNGYILYIMMQQKQEIVAQPKQVVYAVKKIDSATKSSYDLTRNDEDLEDTIARLRKKYKERHGFDMA